MVSCLRFALPRTRAQGRELRLKLVDDGMCFVCGRSNPIGLKLEFALESGRYVTRFTPRPEHQGYEGVTHGGIVAAVLDEVMARLVYALGHRAPTAELAVRFKRPASTSEELTVTGWVTAERGRLIQCAAEARTAEGELVAEAAAKMLKISAKE